MVVSIVQLQNSYLSSSHRSRADKVSFVLADFELSNDDDDEEEDEEEDASEDFGHSDEDDFNPFGSGSDSEEVRIPPLSVKPIKQ